MSVALPSTSSVFAVSTPRDGPHPPQLCPLSWSLGQEEGAEKACRLQARPSLPGVVVVRMTQFQATAGHGPLKWRTSVMLPKKPRMLGIAEAPGTN